MLLTGRGLPMIYWFQSRDVLPCVVVLVILGIAGSTVRQEAVTNHKKNVDWLTFPAVAQMGMVKATAVASFHQC